jgi:putative phosphoesterase
MRIAALYDIHANLPALEAVLDEVRAAEVDAIVIGGDALPGPMPSETMELLSAAHPAPFFLLGNGDEEVRRSLRGETLDIPEAIQDVTRWNASQLTAEQAASLDNWPATQRLQHPIHGPILFCHASPRNNMDIFFGSTPEAALSFLFEELDVALVICGHTHMPFDRTIAGVRVVNAGSVGMPFGSKGVHWLLIDDILQPQHLNYDLHAAAERVRASDYPQANEFADRSILDPPTQADVLKAFGPRALG